MQAARRRLALAALALAASAGAGCASAPATAASYSLVGADKIVGVPAAAATSLDDGGKVVIVRESAFWGFGVDIEVRVNGVAVVRLGMSDRYEVFLQDGEYVFGIVETPNPFGKAVTEISAPVRRGQTSTLRVIFGALGPRIERAGTLQ